MSRPIIIEYSDARYHVKSCTRKGQEVFPSIGQEFKINNYSPVSSAVNRLRKKLESYGEAPTIRLNADKGLNMEEVFVFLDIARRNRYKVILGTQPSGS